MAKRAGADPKRLKGACLVRGGSIGIVKLTWLSGRRRHRRAVEQHTGIGATGAVAVICEFRDGGAPCTPRIVGKTSPMSIRKKLWILKARGLPSSYPAASVRQLQARQTRVRSAALLHIARRHRGSIMVTLQVSAQNQLRQLIEQIERLEEEKKALAADIRDKYAEAKALGFDVKVMRKIISLRKKSPADRQEEEAILATYLHALGMAEEMPEPVMDAAE